jgi:hypothetical protein
MRLALLFGRPDVDDFLADLDADQFAEWAAFLAVEPAGWPALSLITTRLGYLLAQTHSSSKLRERDFELRPAAGVHDDATERARWDAYAIRSEVAEAIANGKAG